MLPTDTEAVEVAEAELRAHPRRYAGQRVRSRGFLTIGLEQSDFAGAWAALPVPLRRLPGRYYVDIVGRVRCAPPPVPGRPPAPGQGFGHFVAWQQRLAAPRWATVRARVWRDRLMACRIVLSTPDDGVVEYSRDGRIQR